jgi:hypothetical protein
VLDPFFELDRLKVSLEAKGIDPQIVELLVRKANNEIAEAIERNTDNALEQAVQAGVDKRSADFINELRVDAVNFQVTTDSGSMDFTEPPFPMLPFLLKNAKPNKDGSGVHKLIPVGKPGNRPPLSTNIHDAQKRIMAERIEASKRQYRAVAPAGSVQFRTASSKQDPNTQWVKPAQEKDFSGEMHNINEQLRNALDDEIHAIIRSYEELF